MEKRFSQRTSSKLLAAAVASVGLLGAAAQSNASLVIDVRATNAGAGGTINNSKSVTTLVGSTVTLGVFATITGTNSVQQVGDFGSGGPDTRNDDGLQTVTGSFNSVGGVTGNMTITGAAGPLTYGSRTSPFNSGGSSNGSASDWDSDGDLDIGNGNSTDPGTMFVARTPTTAQATLFSTPAVGWSAGPDGGALSGNNANDQILNAQSQQLQIGTIRFVVTGAGAASDINFVKRIGGDPGLLWFEDGVQTGFLGQTGFSIGAPVNVVVPEPASLGLLGVAGLGLLARRRDKKA